MCLNSISKSCNCYCIVWIPILFLLIQHNDVHVTSFRGVNTNINDAARQVFRINQSSKFNLDEYSRENLFPSNNISPYLG